LSVVVPAYNEAARLEATIAAIRDRLDADGRPWELIVADDGSTDATPQVLARASTADPRVRALRDPLNRGKGHAVRRGMLKAAGGLRLHCDADCAPSLASLPKLLALIEDADVVIGSRKWPDAAIVRPQPVRRRLAGGAFRLLLRVTLDERARDLSCGFKLWRAPAATATFQRTRADGWLFDAEAVGLARRLGLRVVETGVRWGDRDDSRLSMHRVLVPALVELVAVRRNLRALSAAAEPGLDAAVERA
jgi:dolichyl-phosphate beta-glucosyltransferase